MIVSENLARESWGSAAGAVGKRIQEGVGKPWYEVIGVAQDVHYNGVDERAPSIVYWPAMIGSSYFGPYTTRSATFVVRSSRAGTLGFLNQVQEAARQVNAGLPVASLRTMQEIYSKSLARTSFALVMLVIAASMALALGIIGIYGCLSYAVSQRTREIGIRLALGAQKSELRWIFVRSALALAGVGIIIGLGAAALVAQMMRALLFGISPIDPVSFAVMPLILAEPRRLPAFCRPLALPPLIP